MEESKTWTIMIYMAGDNDLSEEFVWSLMEMFKVGAAKPLAVFVEFDSCSRGDRKRYQIPLPKKDLSSSFDGLMDSGRLVANLQGQENDPELTEQGNKLKNFITASIKQYEAAHHLLILAGHGGGAISKVLLKDRHPVSFLTLDELQNVLRKTVSQTGKTMDIIGLDSCVMNALEVQCELQQQATYFVASQGLEPRTGWPLFRVLEALNQQPQLEPAALAQFLVQTHTAYYANYEVAGLSTDLAACDVTRIQPLLQAVKSLAALLNVKLLEEEGKRKHPHTDALIQAHWKAQSYKFEDYVDLWDFCDLLEQGDGDAEIKSACRKVKRLIGGTNASAGKTPNQTNGKSPLVLQSCYSGASFQHSHGVSIYFPWVKESEEFQLYQELDFAKQTAWGDFLNTALRVTEREPRPSRNPQAKPRPAVENPMDSPLIADFNSRLVEPASMGEGFKMPKVKNSPTVFFRDECGE
ncbi:MAG: hypothetical protein HY231_02895 [Acidobacteria bacterium]|nr:hypothetical protein [Acidobacteriota bacterium]